MTARDYRKNPRKDCIVPVDGKAGGVFENVYTIDVSAGGIGFVSKSPMTLHQRIPVELEFGLEREPVLMMAEVKWVQPLKQGRDYRIGLKFIKVLASGSKSRLTQYFGA